MSEPIGHLRLEGVSKRFGGSLAVDAVTLDIPRGAFATLLGPSGCGKTTTLRMIAGFHDPDAGSIWLGDRRLNELPANRRGTAMVFQDYALFPHMTVRGNVAYGLKLARVGRAELKDRVDETLAFVGLGALGERYPNQLSGGQQQRVALARALVIRPEVLLLDEPLSNLDAKLREQLRWELRSLQRRLQMTFVYVTHDQEEALAMSDWIAVMNGGRVEQAGSPWDIYYHPRTAFLADFVGSVNLVPVHLLSSAGGRAVVELDGVRFTVPCPQARPAGAAVLCIRPESLKIGRQAAGPVSLPGSVIRLAFLGDRMRYWLNLAGREWIADQGDPGGSQELDGEVVLSLDPARTHLIFEPGQP